MIVDGVDKFMRPVIDAIKRHVPYPSEAFTDIYNRAYEAVAISMEVKDKEIESLKNRLHDRNGGWI